MAGAIDMHSHICGGKVNLARTLLVEDHRADSEQRTELKRGGGGRATPSTFVTGYRYAEMGYTAAFEPAMVAGNARHAHAELADTPIIDKGCYVMLGNEDVLLRMLANNEGQSGDQRLCRLDAAGDPGAGGEGRQSRRHQRLQVQHPRSSAWTRPVRTTASRRAASSPPWRAPCTSWASSIRCISTATIWACPAISRPRCRPSRRERRRAAAPHPRAVPQLRHRGRPQVLVRRGRDRRGRQRAHKHISVDVGQIMFGQTITASGDTMMQYRNRGFAKPRKWLSMDIECRGRLRPGAVPLSRPQFRERPAVGDRARAVPAWSRIPGASSSPPTIRTARPSRCIRS